jgi:hypothetical protein
MIEIEKLNGYKKTSPYSDDYMVKTPDDKYELCFYNVEEHSMGSYYGHFAIFFNEVPVVNSGNVWICYLYDNTFMYTPKSDCLIFRMSAYQEDGQISPAFPYLLIKPQNKIFAFLEWNFTSFYYSFDEVDGDLIKIKEIYPEELDRIHHPRKTGEIIDLNTLTWNSLTNFDKALVIYLNKPTT